MDTRRFTKWLYIHRHTHIHTHWMVTKYQQQSPVQINCTRNLGFNCFRDFIFSQKRIVFSASFPLLFCVLFWNISFHLDCTETQCDICSITHFNHQKNERMRMTLRIVCVCVFVLWLEAVKMTIASFVVCLFIGWCLLARCVCRFILCVWVFYVFAFWMKFHVCTWTSRLAWTFCQPFFFLYHICWLGHKIIAQHTVLPLILQGLRNFLYFSFSGCIVFNLLRSIYIPSCWY